MAIQYNVSAGEIVDFLFDGQAKGFTEEEIQKVETRLGMRMPPVARDFMLKYEPSSIYKLIMRGYILPIVTFYDWVQDILKSLDEKELDEENIYYKLKKLSIEKWGILIKNYVLLWIGGDWVAGFLLSDLQSGISNPPVYVSVFSSSINGGNFLDGNPIKFNSTEDFLMLAVLYEGINNSGCIDEEYIDDLKPLKEQGIDLAKLQVERYYPMFSLFGISPMTSTEILEKIVLEEEGIASGTSFKDEGDDDVQAGCCIADDKLYFYFYSKTFCKHRLVVAKRGSGKK